MNIFKEIHDTYRVIDRYLSYKEVEAESQTLADYWANMRAVNDKAYFVVLFSRLEVTIKDRFKKKYPDIKNPTFKVMLSSITPDTGQIYKSITYYYGIRNKIAHGAIKYSSINIADFIRFINTEIL
ncbi:MAG: hypothetical protein SFH39_14810 [Candidatus Magnetobacterium sp. LHC-1]|nr:hypothetical protein [Nitrospirota bacterium]